MISQYIILLAALASLARAGPVHSPDNNSNRNNHDLLDGLRQRFRTSHKQATYSFTNANIKTSDGRCLTVDSSTSDASNAESVQLTDCKSTAGEQWVVITEDTSSSPSTVTVIANAETRTCLTYDASDSSENTLYLSSCTNAGDGASITSTHMFLMDQSETGSLSLAPQTNDTSCLTAFADNVGVADCDDSDASQGFILESVAAEDTSGSSSSVITTSSGLPSDASAAGPTCEPSTVTVTTTSVVTAPAENGTTTTIFIVLSPVPTVEATTTSSTTTVFVTVQPTASPQSSSVSTATEAPASTPLTSSTETVPKPSSAAPTTSSSITTNIPRISINPSTTVVVSTASNTKTIPQVSINPSTTVVVSP